MKSQRSARAKTTNANRCDHKIIGAVSPRKNIANRWSRLRSPDMEIPQAVWGELLGKDRRNTSQKIMC